MKLGVYLHGFVGDGVAAAQGEIGLIASDIIDGLPAGMSALAGRIP
jgi:NAD(P)H-hydrate repair Nnr-like enzyme with NAD(P)H-hydrate dehydratase domain